MNEMVVGALLICLGAIVGAATVCLPKEGNSVASIKALVLGTVESWRQRAKKILDGSAPKPLSVAIGIVAIAYGIYAWGVGPGWISATIVLLGVLLIVLPLKMGDS